MVLFSRIIARPALIKQVLPSSIYPNMARMSSQTPTFEFLSVTVPKDYIFHVELNRPTKLNAITHKFFSEIKECFDHLSLNEDCRIVVLSGAGKLFTAGIDFKDFAKNGSKIGAEEDIARKAKLLLNNFLRPYQQSMSSLERCNKPVIAAIHNACIGAGVDLVTAADMRYCTKDAYFQVKEVDLGLAADIGSLQRLPKVIGGDSLVRELCYTCRQLPAHEALNCGLVSKVYDNKEEMLQGVLALAEEISKKSPVAVQTTKTNLIYSRDHTVQEGLDQIALLNQAMLQSEDLLNATMAQITKDSDVVFSKL
ncbi:unnamed protein product [Ceutorhynchus assimilis]|uniref:Delta(3,5)-Delta(2,4)-dienoyl-CoA isomerase, mitochondrial n=1 Tax=Ceutorhynchus assimilis TaxID=467358 RepID=A0A9N9MH52_9CUCU|nr:unnamed protein product [Ceutorhynchus assimilis]